MSLLASSDVITDLTNLHRGLHLAMDALMTSRDHEESARILRLVDQRLSNLINTVETIY